MAKGARYGKKIKIENVYTTKIKITDKKLAEFNFKVLHLILPCGVNLKRWGIKDNNKCKICSELHDIPHLLFYCTQAKIVWEIVSRICGIDASLRDVILSDQESDIAMLVIVSTDESVDTMDLTLLRRVRCRRSV